MTRTRPLQIAAALLSTPMLVAYGAMAAEPQAALEHGAWTLSALPGTALPAGATATLSFADGRMQGSDGCNRWGAPYMAADGKLQVTGPMVGTQMACPEPAASLATAFHAAMSKARGYRMAGAGEARTLELTDAAGTAVARFAAQATTLAGTAWTATGYHNGRQAVVSVEAGTSLSLAFGADGRVTGTGGCNAFDGPYRVDGERLTIGPLAFTRKTCSQPATVMAQEADYLNALQSTVSFRREADRLDLRTADGAQSASLTLRP